MHGNQPSGVYAGQGLELYGNKIISSWNIDPFFAQRGGKALVFYNKVVSSAMSGTTEVWEEYADSISPPATAPDGTPQHVNNSYYWNNRKGASGTILFNVVKTQDTYDFTHDNVPPVLAENRDYFNQNDAFNGTTGIGVGTLASRPTTCTTGVGYWATTQSPSSIDDANVGANPITPLSGTLYKCVAPNTWTAFYTPYTYPHPFRAPAPPTDVAILR